MKSEGVNWVEGDAGEDETSAAITSPTWVGGGAAGGMAEEAGSSISNRPWVVAMGSLVVVHCLGVTRHDNASCLADVARKGKSTRSPMFQAARGLGCVRLPTITVDIAPRKVSGKFWLEVSFLRSEYQLFTPFSFLSAPLPNTDMYQTHPVTNGIATDPVQNMAFEVSFPPSSSLFFQRLHCR